jgi:hypothetical protein
MVKRLHARQSSTAPYLTERSGVNQRTVADEQRAHRCMARSVQSWGWPTMFIRCSDILTSLGRGPKRYTGMDDDLTGIMRQTAIPGVRW